MCVIRSRGEYLKFIYFSFLCLFKSQREADRSKDRSLEYIFFRFPLIFLFRNVFLPLSLFLSPLLRPSFSNSQTSLAYSAKFGQIEQLIKSQYVIINRRDVSVNVGRRKRIVFKRNSRRSRWRSMRGGHFVENRKEPRKFHVDTKYRAHERIVVFIF